MAARPRVLIAGGYGTFGRLLARALAPLPVDLIIAGRDADKAAAFASEIAAEPMALDLADLDAVATTARGCFALVCTAGPFQDLDRRLPSVVAREGAHWLDTADEASWILDQIDMAKAERASIISGLSSTPALTGALARWCSERAPSATRATVSLLIGNKNTKGAGSIASVLASGLSDPEKVSFPRGTRTAYRFPSADSELLARALALRAEMRVALEFAPVGMAAARLGPVVSRLGPWARRSSARALATAARPFQIVGTSGGTVQAEVWEPSGRGVAAALTTHGQELAILPCVIALEELLGGRAPAGVIEPSSLLAPIRWIERMCARGATFHRRKLDAARNV